MIEADGTLQVTPRLRIPWRELAFHASRAGGPGGQHVNKTSTRIELRWNLVESPSLSENQRQLLLERLSSRLDRRGRIRVVSDERRSQRQNRDVAVDRLVRLLAAALHVARPRKATKPTRASVEQRLGTKKHRSETKQGRRPVRGEE
jgi:ribosome-associated protein